MNRHLGDGISLYIDIKSFALNMRDFLRPLDLIFREAFGPSEKDFQPLRKQAKSNRSFARSKTRKQSCRINASFPRPTYTLIQKKGDGVFGNKQTTFYHSCKGYKP